MMRWLMEMLPPGRLMRFALVMLILNMSGMVVALFLIALAAAQ